MLCKHIDKPILSINQSVISTGVLFVKGAIERNEFFEKNTQIVMYDEQGKGLIISGTN